MRRTNSSASLQTEAEQHNQDQWINRLPVELLSRIFLIGDKMDELDALEDPSDDKRLEFQEVVVQVCHHWRTVAIAIPMLWTYIRIDASYPYPRAALFLARSGNAIPLDLELDMTGGFMMELEAHDGRSHAKRTIESLEFIVENGGITSRWASLSVWSELPSVLLAAIDFISEADLDSLHTLGLVNDPEDPSTMHDLTLEALLGRDLSQPVIFHKPPPLLRIVELVGIANGFFFANPTAPLVSNLSSLELSTVPTLPPFEGLYELLMHNLGLEVLVLDMSMVQDLYIDMNFPREKQVRLQHLRQFTLKEPYSTTWALFVLVMIDAPGLKDFTLNLENTTLPLMPGIVAVYAIIGRTKSGQLVPRALTVDEANDAGPIYPVLERLTLGPFPDEGRHISNIIRHFDTITYLDWQLNSSANGAILELTKLPIPCPQLQHLRVYGIPDNELLQVVRVRKQQGKPLKVVEINSRDWGSITDSTKTYLSETLEKFGQYTGEDSETDGSEENDSTDSDDDSEGSSEGLDEDEDWTDTDDSGSDAILSDSTESEGD